MVTPPIVRKGDLMFALNPYLFIIFLEPLLRWLEINELGYHFNTSPTTYTTTTYADDQAVITTNI
jgi:hypothetical protein